MRREPAALAIVALVVYGATVLLYVLGILYPGENPPGPHLPSMRVDDFLAQVRDA
jgi:hypothetical protein